ncbi:fluoride efflux transporter FluC [Microbacterium thalassium]|uniref:Fluoride-specific ion channel FluC n=1 Tax=Microbacterium thalassium TaxID=362649 RepID=A0A7X0FMC8_9MICO|nr:CrcB family protein [Microbacterium thalassium]MBB6390089.1 CrcB protein [Microbacterium thalassium]
MPQPVDARTLGLVVAGGAVGVLARAAIVAPVIHTPAEVWVTFAVNVAGSLMLGVVVGFLGDRSASLRAFLGTGALGGFTTYSAFAVASAQLLTTPWIGLALMAASLVAGVIAALMGLFIGRRLVDAPGEVERAEDAE